MSSDEFEVMKFGTRATSKSRKRLGRGKQSSTVDDAPAASIDNVSQKKIKSKGVSSGAFENPAVGTMAVLRGIDKCFVGARQGAKGLRGALDKNKSRISLTANGGEMDYFETTLTRFDPMLKDRSILVESHLAKNGLSWLWRMQIDFNILLFGVGCKRTLLSKFVQDYLHGNEVLMIDGDSDFSASSNRIIKELLDGICIKILKRQDLWSSCIELESFVKIICDSLDIHYCREVAKKSTHKPTLGVATNPEATHPKSIVDCKSERDPLLADFNDPNYAEEEVSVPLNAWSNSNYAIQKRSASLIGCRATTAFPSTRIADPKWGGRYSHAQAKLYIVVRNIDGESLQSDESQMCLSLLAACSSVSLIATSERLNTPVMWSPQLLSKFRWANYHVPTYESYAFNPTEVNSLGGGSKEFPGGARALEYIFKSLTKRHEELVSMLARDAIKQCETDKPSSSSNGGESCSTASYRGMNIEELLVETSRSVVARSMPELNTLLQELVDHKIVNKAFDSQRKLFVWITLPLHTLRKLAASF
jgi:Origin recognition complex subunit 2